MKIPSAIRLAPLLLLLAPTLSPAATAQKKAAPPKQAEAYAASVPTPTLAGVRYGEHERHILDFWRAESATPTPVAFVIHGGGWTGGSKERMDRFADAGALLKAGISVVAINYRYTSHAGAAGIEPPVKAPLHDAARALQFVRSKAAEWNLDKARIGAAGGSAGACSRLAAAEKTNRLRGIARLTCRSQKESARSTRAARRRTTGKFAATHDQTPGPPRDHFGTARPVRVSAGNPVVGCRRKSNGR